MTTMNIETIWPRVCKILRARLNPDTFSRWIAVIMPKKESSAAVLTLMVSNDFYQSWLEENYLGLIKDVVHEVCGQPLQIQFEVNPEAAPPDQTINNEAPGARKNAPAKKSVAAGRESEITLNPKYVFDSFVIGPSNNFAHASSFAVAQAPGKAHNPLFIYGGVGLGKTHLMQAIGHYILAQSKMHVYYLSCESLMNEYIDHLGRRRLKQFRDKYRTTDLLLIDDIHFLARTNQLQEEFFHTFNVLYDAHKQIVMTSDRPASEITGLEQRLVSRFEWGLVTELSHPDFETRLAILRFKQKAFNVVLPEDVLVFIASRIRSNIRNIEGALNTLTFYSSLNHESMTVPLAEKLLQNSLEKENIEPLTIDTIQRAVANMFDVRMGDMASKHRSQSVAFPRQLAMYLCRTLTKASLPEIGSAFGKTHATVIYSCRQIGKQINTDQQLKQVVEKLTGQFNKSAPLL